ncbi:MAG: hypothetical protein ACI9YE_003703 [Psychroserpens sp.]|jgi:hypothetical protein
MQIGVLDDVEWLSKPKWMRYPTYFKRRNKGIIKQREVCQRMIDTFGILYFKLAKNKITNL